MNDKLFWNFCVFMYDFWHNLEYKSYQNVANCILEDIVGSEQILESKGYEQWGLDENE